MSHRRCRECGKFPTEKCPCVDAETCPSELRKRESMIAAEVY